MNVENERNINNITCDDLYQYSIKKKDVSTINYPVYNELVEHADKIIDTIKQVDVRNDPIKETRIVEGVSNLSTGVGYLEPSVIGIIKQGSIKLSTNLVTHVLTNFSKQISMTSLSPLNTFQS